MSAKPRTVKIVVMGDIGRSPRMQYHAISLAEHGYKVDILGYGDTEPHSEIKAHSLIMYHYLVPLPVLYPQILNYTVKTVFQALNLLFLLLFTEGFNALIIQNPPAIPSLLVCWIYSRLIGAKLIIDWHNYAYSIMEMKVGPASILTRITKRVEEFVGQRADYNICVTNAMREDLRDNWNIKAKTLYDRPADVFKTINDAKKRNAFLKKFFFKYIPQDNHDLSFDVANVGVLVSSTSWTEDEDFTVLLKSLEDYESHCCEGNYRNLPHLVCVITGKGYLKSYYAAQIRKQNWAYVHFCLPWLEIEEYAKLLACAHLGVSLHTSSSGLDLPMKVIDMFGCGLPVCAFKFNCLDELVEDGINSFVFNTVGQLTRILQDWFENFPNSHLHKQIDHEIREKLKQYQELRWHQNWTNIVKPIVEKCF